MIAIIVLGLLWCDVGSANILLVNCRNTWPPGFVNNLDGHVWEEGKIHELSEGEIKEYHVNFDDGYVYKTHVIDDVSVNILEKLQQSGIEGAVPDKVSTRIYKIFFVNEEKIIAKNIMEYKDPTYNHYEELTINLNTNETSRRVYADTEKGRKMVELVKKMIEYPLLETCERNSDQKKYWWVVVLIVLMSFFIYTQTVKTTRRKKNRKS